MICFVAMFTILNIQFGLCSTGLCANGRCCDGFKLDSMNNTCIACLDGFIGEECKISCPYPAYGRNCDLNCDCEEKYCNVSMGCLQGTTVPLQKTKINRSSGLNTTLTTLLTTSKVVHNETNNKIGTKCPKHVSAPDHHSKTTLLKTSLAALSGIFFLLSIVHFLIYCRQKFYEQKIVFQELAA